jgi:hypothetical protein
MTSPDRNDPRNWTPATPEDLQFSLAYSLGWGSNGRPHGKQTPREEIARWQVEHLALSGYVIMKKPPVPPHSIVGLRPDEDGKAGS